MGKDRYIDPISQLQAEHARQNMVRMRRLKPVQDFLTEAATKIADAHAAEMAKLRLSDPQLNYWRELLRGNRDELWQATLEQADARFGSQLVSTALLDLGRDRMRM